MLYQNNEAAFFYVLIQTKTINNFFVGYHHYFHQIKVICTLPHPVNLVYFEDVCKVSASAAVMIVPQTKHMSVKNLPDMHQI